jgi:hypothetical protein
MINAKLALEKKRSKNKFEMLIVNFIICNEVCWESSHE